MKTPENNAASLPPDPKEPKITPSEKDVVTNSDEAGKVTNNDGLVADSEGIQETLSESEPTLSTNADADINSDTSITNTDEGTGEAL